ncbi:phage major capsid protein [Clostridium merdae]|uniref:phage major capsid protein n=1 Tax=Clostridium merdae TaxID=1958780 RepID=UPI001FA831EA|nr:phage major capsid protein [Clostridium merdae]
MKNTYLKPNIQLFAMKSLDLVQKENAAIMQKINQAVKDGDDTAFSQAFTEFAESIQQAVLSEAKELMAANDVAVLAQRGVRQLTGEETKYYNAVIGAMKSGNPKQAVTDLEVVMPKTVIDSVFEDLITDHPLLDAIDFQNAGAVTEWLLNENPRQLATWSPLCAEIVKELTSGFRKIDLQQNKLSAFLPVCKAMLDLGPAWLDRYVRTVLSEALYFGLEDGVLNGKGQTANLHEPIGMRKDMAGSVSPTTGYPDKEKVVFTSFDPITYGALLATMAKTENDNPRIVQGVILVVSPTDYLTKVMPATTVRGADGTYTNNVFPFPTTVIQSTCIADNEAIIGLGKRYLMAAGTGKSGKIEYDDSYHFLEDERMYLTKFYGHGQPKDNNSFKLLDITNLKPTVQQVVVNEVKGTVKTKEQA